MRAWYARGRARLAVFGHVVVPRNGHRTCSAVAVLFLTQLADVEPYRVLGFWAQQWRRR
jgi:hypothetical protein